MLQEATTLPADETEHGDPYHLEVAVLEDNRQVCVDPHNKFQHFLVRSTVNIANWPYVIAGVDERVEAARGRALFYPGVPGSMNPFCTLRICLAGFVVTPLLLCWRYLTHITGQVDGLKGIVHGLQVIERNPLHVTIPLQCSYAHNAEMCQ